MFNKYIIIKVTSNIVGKQKKQVCGNDGMYRPKKSLQVYTSKLVVFL